MGSRITPMNPLRHPEHCEYRRVAPSPDGSLAICELGRRVAGYAAPEEFAVDRNTCQECCRSPLPTGASLNPVVASLVFAAASKERQTMPAEARQQVSAHYARHFAARWLATSDNGETSSPRTAPSEAAVFPRAACNAPFVSFNAGASSAPQKPHVGLVGRRTAFGLGHQNLDIARHLEIDRWLIPWRASWGDRLPGEMACRLQLISPDPSPTELAAWMEGLDAVMFIERPPVARLTDVARQLGVRVVCVPNWEFLHPGLEWLEEVDLMLCPARCTAELLEQWKSRFGFRWQVAYQPWPVDTDRFRFRRRHVCRRFVFVNGSGGAPAFSEDCSTMVFFRKGLATLLAAARLAPEIPIIVYTCVGEPAVPPNVQLRTPTAHNALLYCDGDVCVQPSHWEGLGLPLLECQAAGMPLITTNVPPMNEHEPWAVIPATEEAVYLSPQLCIGAARIQPEDLAGVLRSAYGRRIGAASKRARRFIERHHSWPVARPAIWRMIEQLVSSKN